MIPEHSQGFHTEVKQYKSYITMTVCSIQRWYYKEAK
jgi:hypothetical protein